MYEKDSIFHSCNSCLSFLCVPLTLAQSALAGRWKTIILSHLHEHEVIRFNELLRMMPGVSRGILTGQLHELEEVGLVHLNIYCEFNSD